MDVCAIDELASKKLNKKFEYGFVVNLFHPSEPGTHWVGLYVKRKNDLQNLLMSHTETVMDFLLKAFSSKIL